MSAARSFAGLLLVALLSSACELVAGIDDRKVAEAAGGSGQGGAGAPGGSGGAGVGGHGGGGGVQSSGGVSAAGGGSRLGGATAGASGLGGGTAGGVTGGGGGFSEGGGTGTGLGGATALGGRTGLGGITGLAGTRTDAGSDAPADGPGCVAVPGTGNGLIGEYFSGSTLSSLKVTRLDVTIDFVWSGAPEWNMPGDRFSARWSGQVQPRYSGRYTFYTVSDDGVRLWVNGSQIIDDWTKHGSTEKSGAIDLQAGQRYSIKLEYFQYDGSANVQLGWSSDCQTREVIPTSQLYTTTTECPAPSLGTGTGLSGAYHDNQDFTNLRLTRLDPTVSFSWAAGVSPDPAIAATSFSVRWTGQVQAKHSDPTTFYVTADDGVRLFIDDVPVIDEWTVRQVSTELATMSLNAGQKYNLRLEYYQQDGPGQVQLAWASPCQPRETIPQTQLYTVYAPMVCTDPAVGSGIGLRGDYYGNQTLTGTPVTHNAETVSFDWAEGSPDSAIGADNFSVRWTGKIMARHTGTTTFHTFSDDGIKLWVADQLLIDNWSDHQVVEDVGAIKLVAGELYDIKVEYRESLEKAVAKLLWYTPCSGTEVVPAAYLYPPGFALPDAGPDAAPDAPDGVIDGP